MSGSITIPAQFGWVIAAAATTGWLGLWQALKVGAARRVAKIPYPQAYAEQAEVEKSPEALRFNCAQRAHANTLETLPSMLTLALIWGLQQPIFSAAALQFWVLTRVWYTIGYVNYGPKGRIAAVRFSGISSLVLLAGGSWTALKFVMASL